MLPETYLHGVMKNNKKGNNHKYLTISTPEYSCEIKENTENFSNKRIFGTW